MELDKRNIEEYINRFLEGETTNAEEQAIYRFFHTGDVPSHLMGYAPMFAWYEGGMQGEPGMSQPDGQEEVAGGKRSEKVPVVGKEGFYQRIPVAVWSAGIAAMMVIALGLGLIFYSENQAGGSGEDPDERRSSYRCADLLRHGDPLPGRDPVYRHLSPGPVRLRGCKYEHRAKWTPGGQSSDGMPEGSGDPDVSLQDRDAGQDRPEFRGFLQDGGTVWR